MKNERYLLQYHSDKKCPTIYDTAVGRALSRKDVCNLLNRMDVLEEEVATAWSCCYETDYQLSLYEKYCP